MFLFDEPLSNLDAKLRTEMRLEIKKLHHELKQTIVYVTHDQIEAMTMATRIAVMDGGVIQQIGTPDEIYERPANLFVARFVGSPPMNVLEATIELAGNRVVATHRPTGVEMDLSDYAFARQPARRPKALVGLRPEHFAIGSRTAASPPPIFDLPLRYSEKTGSDGTAFLAAADELLAVRVDHSQIGSAARGRAGQGDLPGGPVQRLRCRDPASHVGRSNNREEMMSNRLLRRSAWLWRSASRRSPRRRPPS